MSLLSRIAFAVAAAGVHAVRTRSARAWGRTRAARRTAAPAATPTATLQAHPARGR